MIPHLALVSSIIATLLIGTDGAVAAGPPARTVYESTAELSPEGKIDRLVLAELKRRAIQPAHICSDAVFLRRVFLDVIGTLPTADEARSFLLDDSPNKRRDLIDQLLERDEFADYWAMKWGDLLRVKSEFPINLWPNAVQAYHRWIRTSIKRNMPYDRFVREMLTASGSNFRVPQVNFYRSLQDNNPSAIAQAVALNFMGVRARKWPKERLDGMTVFFSYIRYKNTAEWKEEIVFFDAEKLESELDAGSRKQAVFPDGTSARIKPNQDPRAAFADWLITPENPWFTRNIANRAWSWLIGRGIIQPADDIRPDNQPCNAPLLALLEKELIASQYDLKSLFRLILNSQTYQLSSVPRTKDPAGAVCFASYPVRRLEAEVLVDALCQITGTKEEYSSPIPEPFAFIPDDKRSIALADGSITSSFLELFGRPPRDTGLESERNNRSTTAQRLHMLNSTHIQKKIEQGPKMRELLRLGRDKRTGLNRIYLTILSRFPTRHELEILQQYAKEGRSQGRSALIDLTWALINSSEFLYRH